MLIFLLELENLILPRIAGSSMGVVKDSWPCPRLYIAELSVPLGAGIESVLYFEYRTRNFEQQKFLKEGRQYFSLRHSAVPCSAVLWFIFSTT
jgi:hypothetical protein